MSNTFAREVIRLVVAQIAQGFAYESMEQHALEVLADVVQNFIEEIGYYAKEYARMSDRTESNFHDVLAALEKLNINFKDLLEFYNNVDDVPFVRNVKSFPIDGAEPYNRFYDFVDDSPQHVPGFLPPFPGSEAHNRMMKLKEERERMEYINRNEFQMDAYTTESGSGDEYDLDTPINRDDSLSFSEENFDKKSESEDDGLHSELTVDSDM